jgi:hypothetical protein
MGKALKYTFFIALLALIAFGIWKFKYIFTAPQANIISDKEVILERMEKVNKLITLEAYYSEVYDYKDYYYYDFSPFRKKALIRIKAKVSVGYDFKNIHLVAEEETKTVTIFGFPDPEILSIDHDLDYYDLSQGTFNSFTEEDYNKMNKNAKDFIREKAKDKAIFDEAASKKDELIEMFSWMLQAAGWTLEISSDIQEVKNIENSY